jgi:hypothetical protein
MKSVFLAAVFICCVGHAMAQYSVHGQVGDGTSFLPGVNVAVHRDSTLIALAQTDTLGRYAITNLSAGHYHISCSRVGYDPVTSTLDVNGGQVITDMPLMLMHETAYSIDAVEISATRLTVDQQLDRLVIRPRDNVTYAGNSVLEVLQKTQGVVLNRQSGSIAINGKSGVRILINDKPIQVPLEIALQMLEGMNANQVDRIEFVAVPTSNYDSEGAAGIINIITDSRQTVGTDGSLMLVIGARWAEAFGLSGSVNHRTDRASYYIDYTMMRDHNLHTMRMWREMHVDGMAVSSKDVSPRENITNQQNISAGAEWNIGNRSLLNVAFTGYSRDWNLGATANNTTVFGSDSIRQTTIQAKETNLWRSATGSVGIQHQVSAGRKLELVVDYLFYHNHNPSRYTGNMPDADEIALSKETPIHVLVASAQTLSSDKRRNFSWDAGVKAAISSFDNNVDVQRRQDDVWTDDSRFTSRSTMQERILAAYVSTAWRNLTNWEVTVGLRYENTHTDIQVAQEQTLVRNYGNLFPQLSVKKRINNTGEFYFGYSRRINRPTYNDMAPYVFFWSSESFSSGNTYLLPALSDVMTVGLRYGGWGWVLTYSHTGMPIAPIQPEAGERETLILQSQNLKFLNAGSLAVSYAAGLFRWWDINAGVTLQHQVARTLALTFDDDRSLWGINASANSTFKLPAALSFEVSGTWQSRALSGVSDFLPYGSLNAGLARRLGKNGNLKLSVDDLLYTSEWRIRTSSPANNLNLQFDYDWHNRFVRLSYTWTPGKGNHQQRKSISGSTEERQRVNP